MPTIAKTKRYRELDYRHRKLVQLYSVMSELRLHTNKAVDANTANYYHNKLYVWGEYGPFLTASLESMMQIFYIELDGFIGAFWSSDQRHIQLRKNEQGSLAEYLCDGTRQIRKKSAKVEFEALVKREAVDLKKIHELRLKLAHFKKLNERNNSLTPSDIKVREILDKLADVLHLLGFRRWNKPYYTMQDSSPSDSTQKVIDKLVIDDPKANGMRKDYVEARSKWFGEQ